VNRFKTWLAEGVKFGATVGVWLVLRKIAPDVEGPTADAIQQVAVAFIAGILTFFVLDVVLGRPAVQLVWQQGGKAIPDRRPDLNLKYGSKRVLRVDVMMEGRTPIAYFVGWLSRKLGLRCILTMKPQGTARCVPQAKPDEVTLSGNVITFGLSDGLTEGINSFIEFSVSPLHNSTSPSRIDCRMEIRTRKGHKFWLHRLVRREPGIDGFAIGG